MDAARQLQALVARQPQHLAQVADQSRQPAVAGQALDRLVDLRVGLVVGVDIAGLRVAGQVGVQAFQRVQVGTGGVARGFVGAAAFEQRHQREDLVQVLLGQFVDKAAAARLEPDQPFRSQHLQRFAQRRARDAERLGHRAFVDPGAGRKRMGIDHCAQPVRDFEVQGLLDDAHCHPRLKESMAGTMRPSRHNS
ncbi:hypothetical protein D9M68_573890 [compost metagenome]